MDTKDGDGNTPVESNLSTETLELVQMICNKGMLNRALKEMDIDTDQMPLGTLSDSQLAKGYEVLERIESYMNQSSSRLGADKSLQRMLKALSNEFYTTIPHSFGMKLPPVIDSHKMLQQRTRYLEDLSSIKQAADVMSARSHNLHPADHCYSKMRCQLNTVQHKSETFNTISTMVANTHAPTHDQYTIQVS
jgi:poly [ADP-ribose] polymerase